MEQTISGGHGHVKDSLSAALAQAIQSAMGSDQHDKVLVVITGISEKDGEYDVDVIVIFLDAEASLHPLDEPEEAHTDEKEAIVKEDTMQDFLAAEHHMLRAEETREFDILRENTLEILDELSEEIEIAFYIADDAPVPESMKDSPRIDQAVLDELKEKYEYSPSM